MRAAGIARGALAATRVNALRSMLTSLGIAIAVAAVTMTVAVGSGARNEIANGISSLGTNVLHVYPGSDRIRDKSEGVGTRPAFTEGDMQLIRSRVPEIVAISGSLAAAGRVVAGAENWQTTVEGVHIDFFAVREWPIGVGRGFSEIEERAGLKVVVLGATVAEELFAGANPIGTSVRIGNVPFLVIGVLARKGQSTAGSDLDDIVLVPVKAARSYLVMRHKPLQGEVGNLVIKVKDGASTSVAKSAIEEVLRAQRHSLRSDDDDFFVRDITQFLRAKTAAQNTLGLLLAATAAITLIVGGIGIMNVMLVSVSERTHEIGLRIALGATPSDIMQQFLWEAAALGVLGCLLGVVLGHAGTLLMNEVVDWEVETSLSTVALSVSAAVAAALAFGFYPAFRAAKLNPMVALQAG